MTTETETWDETRERLRRSLGRTTALSDSADNTRTLLRLAVDERWGSQRRHSAWLRDFGDDWVVFEHDWYSAVEDRYYNAIMRVGYRVDDDVVTFIGEPEKVRERVVYSPHKSPEHEVARASERAFKTEVNGRTIITGPAAAFLEKAEKASSGNPMFLNIAGRFVGGERANRNGAFWSTEDLVFGQPTVKNGPLNWLHEERHIVGAITEASLLTPETADDELADPYIAASASMWRWLWPQEASVVEMAAAAGTLWYSMECVSETVICHGENGCGVEVSYMDALLKQGECCEHIAERSAERRFKQPTFMGGAIIVPPVRPGWDSAHATVLSEASKYAERAFEQAGQPDMEAAAWERLMAQVLEFASIER